MPDQPTPEQREIMATSAEAVAHKLIEVAGRIRAGEDCDSNSPMAKEMDALIDDLPDWEL
jgi:hypothetical protein